MKYKAYIQAVDNLEKVLNASANLGLFEPKDLSTLRYNIFVLKVMPYYTGIERKEPDANAT